MAYPPQPEQPHGQQPDPYGQGAQPPSGDFPQQAGQQSYQGQQLYPGQPHPTQQYPQPGGYDRAGTNGQPRYPGYDQQQYGQPNPYGQQYGPGFDGPPPKGKTGFLIGVAVVAVVLIAVGVTGFVAPGFFLRKDTTAGSGGAEKVAQSIVDGINAKDRNALKALKCADAERVVDELIGGVDQASNAKLGQVLRVSDSEYQATLLMTVHGELRRTTSTIASVGDQWCPNQDTTTTTDNIEEATSSNSPAITAIPVITGTPPGPSVEYDFAHLGGTYNGKKAMGIVETENPTGTFCISGFIIY